jgi:hypothetical protein
MQKVVKEAYRQGMHAIDEAGRRLSSDQLFDEVIEDFSGLGPLILIGVYGSEI